MNSTNLAIQRTNLANQRTYLAYMRTGFGIASIAGSFKKRWLFIFGIIMILMSSIQYFIINYQLENKVDINLNLSFMPLFYIFLSFGALYLQFYKK